MTIPSDWRIILDESPPPLSLLLIEGWLRFDNTSDVTLTAAYVIVRGANGILQIGAPDAPHPTRATISLSGTRQQPDFVVNTNLNFGSKVLGAYSGGAIRIFGQPVGKRCAAAGGRRGLLACARLGYLTCSVLEAIVTVRLHPAPASRWTRLSEDALAGSSEAVVGDGGTGWAAGQSVLLLSSAFNPWQVRMRQPAGQASPSAR